MERGEAESANIFFFKFKFKIIKRNFVKFQLQENDWKNDMTRRYRLMVLIGWLLIGGHHGQRVEFRKIGELERIEGYVHLHTQVETGKMEEICMELREVADQLDHLFPDVDTRKAQDKARKRLEEDCRHFSRTHQGKRGRRGFVTWALSSIFTAIGLEKVSDWISGRSEEQWKHKLHRIKMEQATMRRMMTEAQEEKEGLRKDIEQDRKELRTFQAVSHYRQLVEELRMMTQKINLGKLEAKQRRLPSTLVGEEIIQREMKEVRQKVQSTGGRIGIEKNEWIYQVETTTLVDEIGDLHFVTHVPIVKEEKMEIFEKSGEPMLVEKEEEVWTMRIKTEEKYVVTTEDREMMRSVKEEELKECWRIEKKFFCDKIWMNQPMEEDCLIWIFKGEWKEMRQYCEIEVRKESWRIVKEGKRWKGFSKQAKPYIVQCQNNTKTARILRGLEYLEKNEECDVYSPHFEIGHTPIEMVVDGHMVELEMDKLLDSEWIWIQRNWNHSQHAEERKQGQTLEELKRRAEEQDKEEAEKEWKDENSRWSMIHSGVAVSGVLGLSLTIIVVVWCIRRVIWNRGHPGL